MNIFKRVTETDDRKVTVELFNMDGEPRGNVFGPIRHEAGTISRRLTLQDGRLSSEGAVAAGIRLAKQQGVEMVVVDDDGLWQEK